MTQDDTAAVPEPRFVVHADLSGRVFAAVFLVLAGLAVLVVVVTGALLGVVTAATAGTTAGVVGGLAFLACALGLAAGALWFGWTEGPGLLDETFRRRTGVVLDVGPAGVAFGPGRVVPWAEVRELLVTETDVGGDAGAPEFVPCIAVVTVTGAALPEVALPDYSGRRDIVETLEPVVERWAPQVPVTDRRWLSGPSA